MPKAQWEIEAEARFRTFHNAQSGVDFQQLDCDVIVDPASGTNYDFELGAPGVTPIALEIFRLIDNQADLASSQIWGQIIEFIREDLDGRGVEGFVVRAPYFTVPKFKRRQYAKEQADLLEAEIKAHSGTDPFTAGQYYVRPIEGLPGIVFSTFPRGGAVDPAGTALSALEEKLPDKNGQLNVQGHERIALLVNWGHLVGVDDIVQACSQIDFSKLPNVDQIYFEVTEGAFHLVFDRSIFVDFSGLSGPSNSALEPLYIKWLSYRLARRDSQAFEVSRRLIAQRGSTQWLPKFARQDIVQYGDAFVAANRWDDVEWILDTFRRDPDPAVENEADDPEGKWNYHARTAAGEDIGIITSVRGHVSWLVQKIICAPCCDLYPILVDIVEDYAEGPHLYIRQQVCVPLIELARRRYKTQGDGGPRFMTDDVAHRVEAIAFRTLRENSEYPRVLDWLSQVFVWVHSLSESEVREVVERLIAADSGHTADSVADILIYFSLFRQLHSDQLGPFDQAWSQERLKTALAQGSEALRARALWRIWRLLRDREVPIVDVARYVAAVPDGSYDRSTFGHFYRILDDWMSAAPGVLGPALSTALEREEEFCLGVVPQTVWHFSNMWQALQALASAGPQELVLHCIATILRFHQRITGSMADPLLRALLTDITDPVLRDRAQGLLALLPPGP